MTPRSGLVRFALPLLFLATAVSVNFAAFRRGSPDPLAVWHPADSVTPVPGPLPPAPSAWDSHYQAFVSPQSAAELVFLGDSLTHGWSAAPQAWTAVTAGRTAKRFGVPGDTTNILLWRIDQGLLAGPPAELVVILIGTNNKRQTADPADIAAGVAAVANAVRTKWPAARVLLLAIPPEGRWADDPRRTLFDDVNARTQAFAAANGFAFHDIGACLLTRDGEMTPALSDDETHFTKAGYARIASELRPVIDRAFGR